MFELMRRATTIADDDEDPLPPLLELDALRERAYVANADMMRRCGDYWDEKVGAADGDAITERAVIADLAVLLGVSRTNARAVVSTMAGLMLLPDTEAAFHRGEIDYPKARAICAVLADANNDTCAKLDATVLSAARQLTPGPLRAAVWAAWMKADPAEARRIREGRRVTDRTVYTRKGDNGMAWLSACLTDLEGAEALTLIDELADSVCAGDPRSRAARRADALMALLHGDGFLRCGCEDPECVLATAAPPPRRTNLLQILVGIDTLLGLSANPAQLPDGTPVDPEVVRTLAGDATWQAILVEMRTAAQQHRDEHVRTRTTGPAGAPTADAPLPGAGSDETRSGSAVAPGAIDSMPAELGSTAIEPAATISTASDPRDPGSGPPTAMQTERTREQETRAPAVTDAESRARTAVDAPTAVDTPTDHAAANGPVPAGTDAPPGHPDAGGEVALPPAVPMWSIDSGELDIDIDIGADATDRGVGVDTTERGCEIGPWPSGPSDRDPQPFPFAAPHTAPPPLEPTTAPGSYAARLAAGEEPSGIPVALLDAPSRVAYVDPDCAVLPSLRLSDFVITVPDLTDPAAALAGTAYLAAGRLRPGTTVPTPATAPPPIPLATGPLATAHDRVNHYLVMTGFPPPDDGHGGHSTPPPGALTYKPTTRTATLVRAMWPTCVFPHCTTTAARCELDHRVAFDHTHPDRGGWSIVANLYPLCKAHHDIKSHRHWTYRPVPGGLVWTNHTGLTVVVTPTTTRAADIPTTPAPEPPPPAAPANPALSDDENQALLYEPTWWETHMGDAPPPPPQDTELRDRFREHRAVTTKRSQLWWDSLPPPF